MRFSDVGYAYDSDVVVLVILDRWFYVELFV